MQHHDDAHEAHYDASPDRPPHLAAVQHPGDQRDPDRGRIGNQHRVGQRHQGNGEEKPEPGAGAGHRAQYMDTNPRRLDLSPAMVQHDRCDGDQTDKVLEEDDDLG